MNMLTLHRMLLELIVEFECTYRTSCSQYISVWLPRSTAVAVKKHGNPGFHVALGDQSLRYTGYRGILGDKDKVCPWAWADNVILGHEKWNITYVAILKCVLPIRFGFARTFQTSSSWEYVQIRRIPATVCRSFRPPARSRNPEICASHPTAEPSQHGWQRESERRWSLCCSMSQKTKLVQIGSYRALNVQESAFYHLVEVEKLNKSDFKLEEKSQGVP